MYIRDVFQIQVHGHKCISDTDTKYSSYNVFMYRYNCKKYLHTRYFTDTPLHYVVSILPTKLQVYNAKSKF